MNTVKLLLWAAVLYAILLFLVREILPSESTPAISLTGAPLIVIVVIIARDLANRSTSPTGTRTMKTSKGFGGSPVQFLSSQFRVAAGASDSYFENVVRARLRELLTAKVALLTGLGIETVRRLLSDPRKGPRLLKDKLLYSMLYGPTPQAGLSRITMIGQAIDLIGAWKG